MITEQGKYLLLSLVDGTSGIMDGRWRIIAHTDNKDVCRKFIQFRDHRGFPYCQTWVVCERKKGCLLKLKEVDIA